MSMLRWILVLSLPLYVIDQITKWWIVLNFERGEVRPQIEGFFNLVRVHNQGVAFGFGNGTMWAPITFFCVSTLALVGLIWYWRRGGFPGRLMQTAAALLVAGICGNLTDRALQGFFLKEYAEEGFLTRFTQGYVVDFLDFTIPLVNYRWPSFNVADSCICVAAFLLIISTFRPEPEGEPDEPDEQAIEEGS